MCKKPKRKSKHAAATPESATSEGAQLNRLFAQLEAMHNTMCKLQEQMTYHACLTSRMDNLATTAEQKYHTLATTLDSNNRAFSHVPTGLKNTNADMAQLAIRLDTFIATTEKPSATWHLPVKEFTIESYPSGDEESATYTERVPITTTATNRKTP